MLRATRQLLYCYLIIAFAANAAGDPTPRALVLLSDFGTTERFVASMKGVALGVATDLQVHDLTHQVEPFNIWQASYLLAGTIDYWPEGTVFVSVVDPGVGTDRRSVVAKTKTGHYIVTPDNGSLTLVADTQGIVAIRQIDETVNRRPGSEASHTFHGRDVYAYTGARLAAAVIGFEEVGPLLESTVERLSYQKPERLDDHTIVGNVTHIEMPFGNVVTNIPKSLVDAIDLDPAENSMVLVEIRSAGETVFRQKIPYTRSFGYVDEGRPLLYSDSLQTIGLAVNSGSFADKFGVLAGAEWTIRVAHRAARE